MQKVNPSPNILKPIIISSFSGTSAVLVDLTRTLFNELHSHATRINGAFPADGSERLTVPLPMLISTIAGLPDATAWEGGEVWVTDDPLGPQPYYSDGATWYPVTDLVPEQDLSGLMVKSANLSDVTSVSSARTNLGLGTAAVIDVGTTANKIVQLDGSAKLPAIDGSQLTNLPAQTGRLVAGTPLVINPFALSTTSVQAHGLGVEPLLVKAYLECLTAELGYSVGDRVLLESFTATTPSVTVDATNVTAISQGFTPQIIRKDTHVNANTTAANWKLVITPYKIT